MIKIENPGGGDHARDWGPPFWHGTSAMFQTLNRDKRGAAIDLSDTEARDGLHRLIVERADVLVQNMRPGVAEKFDLGSDALLAEKPALVYCTIGAYGATGPLAERPGYDPLMQAFAGIMGVTGEEGGGPVRVGTSIIDMGAGLWAAIGVLAALERRHRTGQGGLVDTSLLETGIAWMAYHVANYLSAGLELGRWGSGTPVMVPYQAFATADGQIIVAAGNDGIFGKLCAALECSNPGFPRWLFPIAEKSNTIGIPKAIPTRSCHDRLGSALDRGLFSDEKLGPVIVSHCEGAHRPVQHTPVLSGDLDVSRSRPVMAAKGLAATRQSASGFFGTGLSRPPLPPSGK